MSKVVFEADGRLRVIADKQAGIWRVQTKARKAPPSAWRDRDYARSRRLLLHRVASRIAGAKIKNCPDFSGLPVRFPQNKGRH